MSPSRAIIFANGSLPDLEAARRLLRPDDSLLAADGGTRHLLDLGLLPSLVIGDLDSVTADERRRLEAAGVALRQYPRDKNETDLELALQAAVAAGHTRILVVGALGGRMDQTLGNLALLTAPSLADLDVRLDDGLEEAFFVRTRAQVHGRPGEIVSLLPWDGQVDGVTTHGLRWPLHDEALFPDRSRGISNELTGEAAEVSIRSGLLLVIHRRNPQP
jgi:thiamine pyrophosphokinase